MVGSVSVSTQISSLCAQLFTNGFRWIGHDFCQRGIVVGHAQEIGCSPMGIYHRDQFMNQFTCLRADDLRVKEFAGRRRTEEFHKAVPGLETESLPMIGKEIQ